jgi:hypothetical protein
LGMNPFRTLYRESLASPSFSGIWSDLRFSHLP